MDQDLNLSSYRYDLPPSQIAQQPLRNRTASRLLVLHRRSGAIEHRRFVDLPSLLSPKDLLVLNESKVIKARLIVNKDTGGKVDLLLIRELPDGTWLSMARRAGRLKPGQLLTEPRSQARIEVAGLPNAGRVVLRFLGGTSGSEILERHGQVPLPPYIKRRGAEKPAFEDVERYQTVYARAPGSVAAPTAGLHFDRELLGALDQRGVQVARITLHVGPATFSPVTAQDISGHRMEEEFYRIEPDEVGRIAKGLESGRRIVAVGTTTVRTLETVFPLDAPAGKGAQGSTRKFIYPGYRFKTVQALVTNFHLPQTTLLMLVSAFAGRQRVLNAYQGAVERGYRFYSYGDAMLIL